MTGASGFIGKNLCRLLIEKGIEVYGACRSPGTIEGVKYIKFDLLDRSALNLSGFSCVIHLAALLPSTPSRDDDVFKANYEATLDLAKRSSESGVSRFVFVSSIGVHGVSSGTVITEESKIKPCNTYTKSKAYAENSLLEPQFKSDLEIVIVRLPMVYSFQTTGNLLLLSSLVSKVPMLPLGGANNRRSFISLKSVSAFLELCVSKSSLASKVYVLADEDPVSTRDLVLLLASNKGVNVLLFSAPKFLIQFGLAIIGRSQLYKQLFESLEIDSSKARSEGWKQIESIHDVFAVDDH